MCFFQERVLLINSPINFVATDVRIYLPHATNHSTTANNKVRKVLKEAVIAEFMVLLQNLPGVTKENCGTPQSG